MLKRAPFSLLRPRVFPPPVRIGLVQSRLYKIKPKVDKGYKLPEGAINLQPGYQKPERPASASPQIVPSGESSQIQSNVSDPLYDDLTNPKINGERPPIDAADSQSSDPPLRTDDSIDDEVYRGRRHINETRAEETLDETTARLYEKEVKLQEQIKPLPDLTQGIPSTLDAELSQARVPKSQSLNITEDPTESTTAESGGRSGDGLPKSAYISSSEQKKNTIAWWFYFLFTFGAVGYSGYLGRNWATEEEAKKHPEAPNGLAFGPFYARIKARIGSELAYYNEPAFPKLLPEEKDRPPLTLIIPLEDFLIHDEWTREAGWRLAKRPGLDYFLRYLSQYYEVVVWTSQPLNMIDQTLRKLDPYGSIRWPLGREATLYKDGKYIKDLTYLNRDVSKVMLIDTNPDSAAHQPENAIIIPKWRGDREDQTLIQFLPFLEYVANMGFDDVRKVLKSFEGKYIPEEYARREKLLRERFEAKRAEDGKQKPKRANKIGGLFSPSKQAGEETAVGNDGKWISDIIRERGIKQYELMDKAIKDEGEKWLAEREKLEKEAQETAMKDMKGGVLSWFGLGSKEEKK